jgi:HlyD family secretion protein
VTRERSKRKWFYVILIFLLLGAGAFYFWGWIEPNGSNQRYRMVKVERGDITSSVTATGTINPVVTVLVGSQVSGTIKALYADFNSRVKEGQVIAQIDPALFEAQVDQARANVLKAQAGLANAQATVQGAKANLYKADVAVADTKRSLDRNAPLAERKVVAQQVLDTAQANYDSAVAQRDALKAQLLVTDAQVESEKANVENTKAALRMAETNLRYATIRSPVSGIVISRNVDVGQTVAASLQAPTLFTIAKDLTQMQVDTNFSEADIGRIETGQEATFTVDAYPERIFHGRVSEIRNAPQTIQNVVTYDVVIMVANPDLKLKPGMTANVTIIVAHENGVLKIPNAALRFQPQSVRKEGANRGSAQGKPEQRKSPVESVSPSEPDQKRRATVWILSPEGKSTPVSVTLGITDGTFSEIVSRDLYEGAEVIAGEITPNSGQNRSTPSPVMSGGPRK